MAEHPDPHGDASARAARLEALALALPEAQRVLIEAWDHPTFRVRGRNFVFVASDSSGISVKLPAAEAAWVIAQVTDARPTGYGLGRHGWVSVPTPPAADEAGWTQVGEWVRESYVLIAPRRLARQVLDASAEARRTAPDQS